MSEVVRFSVSLEEELFERFERFRTEKNAATRSEAVRQLIHDGLTRHAWADVRRDQDVAGTLTLVYDHHRQSLRDHMMDLQHNNTDLIVSVLHTHLDHEECLEVLVLRGPAGRLQDLAAELGGLKGIRKSELVMATSEETESNDETSHGHSHSHGDD